MQAILSIIASELGLPERSVRNTVDLLDGGATIPFISRYRKEATGSLDEVKIEQIFDRLLQLRDLQRRKEYILSFLSSSGNLTEELQKKISECWDPSTIEDIYLPFKPKRRTRAQQAKDKGLEPLAKIIFSQADGDIPASKFISEKVSSEQEAIDGALDIIAQWINENPSTRAFLRKKFASTSNIVCKVIKNKEKEAEKYRNYFDVKEPLRRCPSHRLLAMRRGEAEGMLKVCITPDANTADAIISYFKKCNNLKASLVEKAAKDAYTRLLCPSIENEFASSSKIAADLKAIEVFASNLRDLLLSPPLGERALIAIDPGIRTGCKVVVLDAQGNLLHNETIFPHAATDKAVYAEMQLLKMVSKFGINTIAIGSGTAGRETREFIERLHISDDIEIYMVNEDGASVYSASEVARKEFPDHDVTVRGAVSIGRRLMDPLSELVKIDPKSIGVGQYQHDVDQALLKKRLNSVTQSCVNMVGVNLNTASSELLSYVSGIGKALSLAIVDYRKKHGAFKSRMELMNVPRLGAKAFEQCAGFLRIPGAKNPLDNSAIHPECYSLVEKIALDLGCSTDDLLGNKSLRSKIDIKRYFDENIGEQTLNDILTELDKPGRDPRPQLKKFEFDTAIRSISDLQDGMILNGKIVNITDFGCFVDLGIKTKGLIHVSKLSAKKITDPRQVAKIGQEVKVKVIGVECDRNRIALSMIDVDQS